MLRNNEMTPLVSSGMPLQRLAAPVFACAALLIAVWMLNREFVLPAFAADIARDRRDVIGIRTRNIDFARDDNKAILRAGAINLNENRLERVIIIEPKTRAATSSRPTRPRTIRSARPGCWRAGGGWSRCPRPNLLVRSSSAFGASR